MGLLIIRNVIYSNSKAQKYKPTRFNTKLVVQYTDIGINVLL